jgi:aminoglycoside phosphotransferase family enzyme/gluconate kinase
MTDASDTQRRLIEALKQPAAYPHPVSSIREIQTHISTVLLTGDYAYKIKKPLDLGFLNFASLADRKRFCEEELRLNRRLAPQLYLDVVAFTGSPDKPRFDGDDAPFEYAVKMRQFDQDGLLDRVLARGELTLGHMDEIADRVTRFHAEAAIADDSMPFGTAEAVYAPMAQNFEQLAPLITDPEQKAQLERLEAWTAARYEELRPLLAARKQEGHIRECHGDMHLGNMAFVDGDIAIFDGIEFNDYFRWIDVMSEIAFLVMDLDDREAHAHARHVLNRYLERSGDYEGLRLLRFYQVYRAMVRAKVSSIRLSQGGLANAEREQILAAYQSYANLAEHYTTLHKPAVTITCGVSGSGKTTVAQGMVDRLGAIRVRSDVERKRLFGLPAEADTKSGMNTGIYSPDASAKTYARLHELSRVIAESGFLAVADATFLKKNQRQPFAELARALDCPYLILDIEAEPDELRRRVTERAEAGTDASEADLNVLEQQLSEREPPADEAALPLRSDESLPVETLTQRLRQD